MPDLKIARARADRDDDGEDDEARHWRTWVARGFTRVEDLVYIGLAVLLSATAVGLLVHGAIDFGAKVFTGTLAGHVVALLDQILLILLVVEVLLTVQVSFREHALIPEPFLIVGLIAVTRRILVLTAEFEQLIRAESGAFRNAMLELGLLTVMVLVLVISLVLLRKRGTQAVAEKA